LFAGVGHKLWFWICAIKNEDQAAAIAAAFFSYAFGKNVLGKPSS